MNETQKSDWEEKKKKILKERAKALAREVKETETKREGIEVMEFSLAQEKYALESSFIREVYPLKGITPLPCVPSFVLGLLNVRGQIFSVVNLKRILDLPEGIVSDQSKVILLRGEEMEVGIWADSISGVRVVPVQEMQPALPVLTGARSEYLKGVTKDGVAVLDARKILADKKIVVGGNAAA